jgi:hypothetical protein
MAFSSVSILARKCRLRIEMGLPFASCLQLVKRSQIYRAEARNLFVQPIDPGLQRSRAHALLDFGRQF